METGAVLDTLSNKPLNEMLVTSAQTTVPVLPSNVNIEQETEDSLNINTSVEVPTTENFCTSQDQNKSDKLATEV